MNERILIVEDNKINCLIYEKIFGTEYTLDFAFDGLTGVQKFEENPYDLILLDLGLPKLDGVSAAIRMRVHEKKQSSKTPIIAVTADDSFSTRRKALNAGVDHFLTKPFSITDIKSLLKTCLVTNKSLILK